MILQLYIFFSLVHIENLSLMQHIYNLLDKLVFFYFTFLFFFFCSFVHVLWIGKKGESTNIQKYYLGFYCCELERIWKWNINFGFDQFWKHTKPRSSFLRMSKTNYDLLIFPVMQTDTITSLFQHPPTKKQRNKK